MAVLPSGADHFQSLGCWDLVLDTAHSREPIVACGLPFRLPAATKPIIAMKPTYILALLALSFCLITPVGAQNKNNSGQRAAQQEAQRRKQEREQKRNDRAEKRDAIDEFMRPRDKNNDGSLTLDEFMSAESDKEEGLKKFNKYNKNGDRSLTKSEIADMLGL
jgi:hypothetical protein